MHIPTASHCAVVPMKVPLLTCLITGVHKHGCVNGIAKVTISACVPISCFGFMSKYILVRGQDKQNCPTSFTCSTAGRAALCGDETCATPVGNLRQNFGIHTVNTSARSSGSLSIAFVVALFISKLYAACQLHKYLCFFDFTAGVWTSILRPSRRAMTLTYPKMAGSCCLRFMCNLCFPTRGNRLAAPYGPFWILGDMFTNRRYVTFKTAPLTISAPGSRSRTNVTSRCVPLLLSHCGLRNQSSAGPTADEKPTAASFCLTPPCCPAQKYTVDCSAEGNVGHTVGGASSELTLKHLVVSNLGGGCFSWEEGGSTFRILRTVCNPG